VPGLDEVLGGGAVQGNSLLIQGTPGSGKSSLGLQMLVSGAIQQNEPGIFFSFDQFPQQLYRDAASFAWDLRALESNNLVRVIFARRDDLYSSFAERESAAITKITDGVIDLGAKRILVDSVSQFWHLPLPEEDQRKLFYEFVMKLKGLNATPILITETSSAAEEIFTREEFAVDTILRLEHTASEFAGGPRSRWLEVRKARGQEVIEGRHAFRIQGDGLRIFPFVHLASRGDDLEEPETGRCSTGVAELDTLLNGGFQCSTSTMIAGMSGTGKTILAAHFVAAGLSASSPAIYVTLNERPGQLLRNMEARKLPLTQAAKRGDLTVLHVTGGGTNLIEFYHQIRELIESKKVKRVVIDGLRDLLSSGPNER